MMIKKLITAAIFALSAARVVAPANTTPRTPTSKGFFALFVNPFSPKATSQGVSPVAQVGQGFEARKVAINKRFDLLSSEKKGILRSEVTSGLKDYTQIEARLAQLEAASTATTPAQVPVTPTRSTPTRLDVASPVASPVRGSPVQPVVVTVVAKALAENSGLKVQADAISQVINSLSPASRAQLPLAALQSNDKFSLSRLAAQVEGLKKQEEALEVEVPAIPLVQLPVQPESSPDAREDDQNSVEPEQTVVVGAQAADPDKPKQNVVAETTLNKMLSFGYNNSTAIAGSVVGASVFVITADILLAWSKLGDSSKKADFLKFVVKRLARFGIKDPKTCARTAALIVAGLAVVTGVTVEVVKHLKK